MSDETRDEAWTRRLRGRSLADAIEALLATPHVDGCNRDSGEPMCWACVNRERAENYVIDAIDQRPELADHPLAVRRREALAGVLEAQQGVQRAIEAQAQAVEAERASRVREVDAAEVVRWLREREARPTYTAKVVSLKDILDGDLTCSFAVQDWRSTIVAELTVTDGRLYLGGPQKTASIVVLPTGEVEVRDEARLSEAARAFWEMVRGMREMVGGPQPKPPANVEELRPGEYVGHDGRGAPFGFTYRWTEEERRRAAFQAWSRRPENVTRTMRELFAEWDAAHPGEEAMMPREEA